MVELVVKVAAAVFCPHSLQRTRSYRNLIGRSADYGFNIHPVGVVADVAVAAIGVAVLLERRHQVFLFESEPFALVLVVQFVASLVTDLGDDSTMDERAI